MELTPAAQAIKQELTFALSKEGRSLQDLESALSNLHNGEGVVKLASLLPVLAKSAQTSPTDLAFGSLTKLPIGIGMMAGLGLDEADKTLKTVNDSLDDERKRVQLIRAWNANLRKEHGLA